MNKIIPDASVTWREIETQIITQYDTYLLTLYYS